LRKGKAPNNRLQWTGTLKVGQASKVLFRLAALRKEFRPLNQALGVSERVKMNEREFIAELLSELDLKIARCCVETHRSLLYSLTIDDDGVVRMGADTESGEPIRGHGKGFEQDFLIYENPVGDCLPVVPRVVAEVKFRRMSTHDAIVYNEKARRVRSVYPYVRYGLILGDFPKIPGRVVRLGQGFDFIMTVKHPFIQSEISGLRAILKDEVQSSRNWARVFDGKQALTVMRRKLEVRARNA
jgi:hypothetical protein